MIGDIYSVVKNLAASGQYITETFIQKIDALWVEDKITDAQRTELIGLAQTCADPNYTTMNETEKALDERLYAVEAAMLDVGSLLGQLMTGGGS